MTWTGRMRVRSFGELEAAIMDVVWSAGRPLLVREVLERLQRSPEPAYTTVQTVMDILHRKGWLNRAKDGRAYRYEPSASREDYAAGLIGEVLAATPDRKATLVRLVETMDASEHAALKNALAAAKRGRRSSR
ncbi:MAG: BlaI/MecI/CopY family transcriptional regulator [Acidimicrobiales bacterium]